MSRIIFNDKYESVMISGNKINYVITDAINGNKDIIYVFVPGIYGDRCDSRSFFVQTSRKMSLNNMTTVRFDYCGGGYNEGNYINNNFEFFILTLNLILDDISQKFNLDSYVKFCLIGVSEGAKVALKVGKHRDDISAMVFCNGLFVEEDEINSITRPILKNETLIFDSGYGVWTNFDFVKSYSNFYITYDDFNPQCKYYGIYGESDNLTKNSRKFLNKQQIEIKTIKNGDHLFLNKKTSNEAINSICELTKKVFETFVGSCYNKQIVWLKYFHKENIINICKRDNQSERCIIFIPGLFQTGSGPGFLFRDIAEFFINKFDYYFIDFPGQGESYGDILNKLDDYVYLIEELIKDIILDEGYKKIVLISNGFGNYVLSKLNNKNNYQKIYLSPKSFEVDELLEGVKYTDKVDTHNLYENNEKKANRELLKISNVRNRVSGAYIPLDLLTDIDQYEFQFNYKDIVINSFDPIFMSAADREKLFLELGLNFKLGDENL